jgi:hypothetical protein
MSRLVKNLIILSLALAVVTAGGWYWYSSAKEARAAVNIPQTAARIPDIVNAMGEVANIDLSDFDSIDQISSLFDVIGGDNATMGQMSDWLDAFGQMGGGVEDLLDGNFRSLGDVVTGLGQITDLGGTTDILNSLGGLGATADDILSGGLNFNNASDLISSLSNVTDAFRVTDLLDGFEAVDGSYSDLLLYAGENGTDIGTIIEQGVVTSTDLEPLAGQGPSILGGDNQRSGVGTQVGQTSQEAKQSLEKDRKQDEQECKAETGGGLLDGFNLGQFGGGGQGSGQVAVDVGGNPIGSGAVTSTELPAPGSNSLDGFNVTGRSLTQLGSNNLVSTLTDNLSLDQLSQLTDKIPGLSSLTSQIPVVGGLLGGASYVPVVEQDGDLIDLTEDTNELTSEIKDLQVQICTHLKTIKRVQLNIEDKEFIGDVKAREAASKRANEAQKQIFNRTETGGKTASGEDTTLKPDVEDYTKDWADQGAAQAVSQTKSSGNYAAQKAADYIEYQNKTGTFANKIASDFSENQIKELSDPEKVKELNSQSLWQGILRLSEPQNNAYGVISMAWDKLSQEKSQGRNNAQLEFLSGGGYVPVKECVEKDDNGVCKKYKVNSTGSTNQHAANEAASIDLQQTLNADEASDLNEDNVPGVAEFETLEPSKNTTNTGGPGGGGAGGGSGPGGNFELSDLADIFTNGDLSALFDLFGSDSAGNGGNLGGFSLRDILDYLNRGGDIGDLDLPPSVTFKLTGPTLEQIYEGRPNVGTISWKAQNADKCVAKNNWLSSSLLPNRVEAVKTANQTLETSGSLITYLPLTFDLRLERTRGNQTVVISFATSTNATLTQQVTSITLGNNQVAIGDRFSLVAKVGLSDEAKVTIETNVASAGAVNSLLGSALTSLSASSAAGQEFGKYRITFTANESGTAFITITADPIYSIRCTGNGRNTDQTVTVSRGN